MKLLVIDDTREFLDSWVQELRRQGHIVHARTRLEKGEVKAFTRKGFQLALVDVCLNEHDIRDRTGKDLALDLHKNGIPSILVTGFCPSETEVFDFLRRDELAGILSKEITEGDERIGLVGFYALRRRCPNGMAQFTLEEKTTIDAPAWQGLLSLLGKKGNKGISASDIAVLFRGLVSPCVTNVTMRKIAKGKSGAALVRAKVSFGDGPVEDDVAIKFGNLAAIRSEVMRYDRFCGPLPDGAVAQLRWRVETAKLGAIAYSWVGDSVNDGQPLKSVDVSWDSRRKTINHLFRTSLNPWFEIYRKGSAVLKTPQLLVNYYTSKGGLWYEECPGLKTLGLPKRPDELASPVSAQNDGWDFGAFGLLSDPIRWLTDIGAQMAFSEQAPSHGDLHVRNVFVLAGHSPRLIDFGRTALGHVYRDFAALEVSLRLTCIDPQTSETAKKIEDCLCEAKTLGQALNSHQFSSASEYHAKELVETIKEIRRAAADCCGSKEPPDAMAQYHFAVLMHMIRYATGTADEVTDDTPERKKLRLWHAHYAAAKIATILEGHTNSAKPS